MHSELRYIVYVDVSSTIISLGLTLSWLLALTGKKLVSDNCQVRVFRNREICMKTDKDIGKIKQWRF